MMRSVMAHKGENVAVKGCRGLTVVLHKVKESGENYSENHTANNAKYHMAQNYFRRGLGLIGMLHPLPGIVCHVHG